MRVPTKESALSPPASGFWFQPFTVASRLLRPHSTEDKIPRLMGKHSPQPGTPKEIHKVI